MCGVVGLLTTNVSHAQIGRLVEGCQRIRHRGPDDEGYALISQSQGCATGYSGKDSVHGLGLAPVQGAGLHQGPTVLLGHRRLSILDVSPAGHQPMISADETISLAFNGEIYNYIELRRELAEEWEFRTESDTEVIMAAYAKWGIHALRRLVGMFAFVLVDIRNRNDARIWLARDPFGIKPMFIADVLDGSVVFGSEIKALVPFLSALHADADGVYKYVAFGRTDAGKGSMLKEVGQIPAGMVYEFGFKENEVNFLSKWKYWTPSPRIQSRLCRSEAAAEFERIFLKSVDLHLRSDVPVGAALSGGLDSSAILCGMRAINRDGALRAFTYVAEEKSINEEAWASIVVDATRAEWFKTTIEASSIEIGFDGLLALHDEPFGSSSIFAQFEVFRLAASNGVKVMLDGQGADELMGGYSGYPPSRVASLLLGGEWTRAYRFFKNAPNIVGGGGWRLLRRGLVAALPTSVRQLIPIGGAAERAMRLDWFRERGVTMSPLLANYVPRAGMALKECLSDSLERTSLPQLLRYEDRNSMGCSVESRVPFLTTEMADFLYGLDEDLLISDDGSSKRIMRDGLSRLVPARILARHDKIGFQTPERSWLVEIGPLIDDILKSGGASGIPIFNIGEARRQWADVLAGKGGFDYRFWRWISVIAWSRQKSVRWD
jgi:asparagine synthase (glutamine-hydrolysing)